MYVECWPLHFNYETCDVSPLRCYALEHYRPFTYLLTSLLADATDNDQEVGTFNVGSKS